MENKHIVLSISDPLVDRKAHLIEASAALAPPPRLFFPIEIYQEISTYYTSSPIEFQLMGLVEQMGSEFTVTDIAVPYHTSGVAHAELNQDMFPAFLKEFEDTGKDVRNLRFQANSHGKLEAHFSDTDVATIREAYACDWMISMVGNMCCNFKARLDIFEPIPLSIALPISIIIPHASHERRVQLVTHLRERGGHHHG